MRKISSASRRGEGEAQEGWGIKENLAKGNIRAIEELVETKGGKQEDMQGERVFGQTNLIPGED
jgi:hypothetical protein